MKPKIVIDKNIPFIQGVLEPFASVVYCDGLEISSELVRDADALIIRTRTKCDAALLQHSSVKFIATATIGFNHIDTEFCAKKGIFWSSAAGCNAVAVGQYVASALSFLSEKNGVDWNEKTLGIVGVGHVGAEVEKIAHHLGMRVLRNDPPRADREGAALFVDLATIQHESDVITFHTPLTATGVYATKYLADAEFFNNLARRPVIINSARDGVVNETALKQALNSGKISDVVIDCWENEPDIDLELLRMCALGTPHIAGYSADGKANATTMSVQAVARFFGFPLEDFQVQLPPKSLIHIGKQSPYKVFLKNYSIEEDSTKLKQHPEMFEVLRNHYSLRRESIIVP